MIGSKFGFSCTRSGRSEAFIATRTRPSGSAAWGMLPKSTSQFCLASQLTCVPHVSAAIANSDPPMQYSLCIWGEARVWTWGARVVCERSARHLCVMLKTCKYRVTPGAYKGIRGAWCRRQTGRLCDDPVPMIQPDLELHKVDHEDKRRAPVLR